jgi:hypothetical protein
MVRAEGSDEEEKIGDTPTPGVFRKECAKI